MKITKILPLILLIFLLIGCVSKSDQQNTPTIFPSTTTSSPTNSPTQEPTQTTTLTPTHEPTETQTLTPTKTTLPDIYKPITHTPEINPETIDYSFTSIDLTSKQIMEKCSFTYNEALKEEIWQEVYNNWVFSNSDEHDFMLEDQYLPFGRLNILDNTFEPFVFPNFNPDKLVRFLGFSPSKEWVFFSEYSYEWISDYDIFLQTDEGVDLWVISEDGEEIINLGEFFSMVSINWISDRYMITYGDREIGNPNDNSSDPYEKIDFLTFDREPMIPVPEFNEFDLYTHINKINIINDELFFEISTKLGSENYIYNYQTGELTRVKSWYQPSFDSPPTNSLYKYELENNSFFFIYREEVSDNQTDIYYSKIISFQEYIEDKPFEELFTRVLSIYHPIKEGFSTHVYFNYMGQTISIDYWPFDWPDHLEDPLEAWFVYSLTDDVINKYCNINELGDVQGENIFQLNDEISMISLEDYNYPENSSVIFINFNNGEYFKVEGYYIDYLNQYEK